MKYTTTSTDETIDVGRQIASKLNEGDVVLLQGDLGAGKTTFVKGIADYFGINPDDIVSPTFTLMQIYNTDIQNSEIKNIVHIDTYRLEEEKQLLDIGAEDYVGNKETISFIEWPEKLDKLIENKKNRNIIIKQIDENTREINFD